jgi:hypothetical protein
MCDPLGGYGPPGGEEKGRNRKKELTPGACGNLLQEQLNNGKLTGAVELVARPLRGLCRWLAWVYVYINERTTKLEERMVDLQAWAWGKDGLDHFAKRVEKLETWMSRVYRCIDDRMTKLEENTPNNARIETLDVHQSAHDERITKLEAAVQPYCTDAWQEKLEQLEAQLLKHTHVRSGLPPIVPPAPEGLEQAEPVYCHQCGIKL